MLRNKNKLAMAGSSSFQEHFLRGTMEVIPGAHRKLVNRVISLQHSENCIFQVPEVGRHVTFSKLRYFANLHRWHWKCVLFYTWSTFP